MDIANASELVVTGVRGLVDELLHGQYVVENDTKGFDSQRERTKIFIRLDGTDRDK